MTLEVTRIVTGHHEFGLGIVVSDEKLSAVSRGLGANISGCEIWSTNSMPVDNSMEAEASQRAGFVKKYNYVGSGQGTTVRIVEWTPGHTIFWHRTETLDYSMVLSGEIDVEFDSGQVVTMKQGDIIVMRGVTHCWKNKSAVPAVTAFILIDAVPFEAEFDSGQVVTMKQGDIIVMRGVTHCWKNKSAVPAVTAFILIDAVPFEAGGEKRGVL